MPDRDDAIELTELEVAELSRVMQAATGREALMLKAHRKGEDDPPATAVLQVPAPGEESLVEWLRGKGVSEDGRFAAVAAKRLIAGWQDRIPRDVRRALARRYAGSSEAGTGTVMVDDPVARRELERLRQSS